MKTINLDSIKLFSGAHSPDSQFCVMELAAYIADEPWSDHPKCVSPVIAAFLRSWNDVLDDNTRQILKPYALKTIGTVGTKADEEKRAWMATDWLVRECAPAFLRLAGLSAHAETLENLAALTGARKAKNAQPHLNAAWDAAWDAAGDAAWDAARAAARDAAWDAAGAAARDAARDAARAAARAAARKKLESTVKILQSSALSLLDRMIALKKDE